MKKQQTIETLHNTLEGVMQEWINTKQELAEVRIELEETQEALRRNRNQLESYKNFEKSFFVQNSRINELDGILKIHKSALRFYENMNLYTFFIHKYFK